jgi:adenine-specific DNA-methyltransferase
MSDLNKIENWKNKLGLLPIHLFSAQTEDKFILLNGGVGDFCIDTNPDKNPNEYFSYAWSSNTKNFVTLKESRVSLYNWLKDKKEDYAIRDIENNLPKFYEYLVKYSSKSEYDITPFILNIYRELRRETGEKDEGINAINQLILSLLAVENGNEIKNINFDKWGLSESISPLPNLDYYIQTLEKGLRINDKHLSPNIDLIFRHSAGELFQEAQKEAIFYNRQLGLFGGFVGDYDLKQKMYSSLHYTPSFLARSIVEYSLSKLNINEIDNLKILDPACGSSEFLLEVLKQLKSLGYNKRVEIHGWDISETAINISKFLLNYEKREWGENLNINIEKVENSLTKEWDNDYDLILMNPPFISWELLSSKDRYIVQKSLGNVSRKKPNLASVFIYKAVNHLKENGIIGTVMPSSILLMDSYRKLREEIKEQLTLLLVGKLGNFVFEDALTDASILIGKKPKSNELPLLVWSKNEKGIINNVFRDLRKVNYKHIPYVTENKQYNIYKPEIYPDKENWKVISYQEQKLKKHLYKFVSLGELKTVQDIFNVKQGIRTGNNKVFKIDLNKFNSLLERERVFFRPVIDNDTINKGSLNIINYVWFPYDKNGLVFQNENELKEKTPIFYEYLFAHKDILEKRKGVNLWWELTRPRNWQFSKYPKLVSTEFGHSGSFAFDKKGEFVVERGNAWIPKKEFKKEDYYYFYLSLFNSSFFEELLSIYSKQLAGGKWYDLGKKYTAEIPIPEITAELEHSFVYEKLVDFGKQISLGEFFYFNLIDDYLKEYIYKIEA